MATSTIRKAIAALTPAIRERRAEIEEARRLPADLAGELVKTGVFALAVPKAIGGEQADPIEIMNAIEAMAAADGSVGWLTMIGVSSNIAAGYMNEQGAREIFTNPASANSAIAGPIGSAVASDGGFVVGGRWPFASGITHAEWVWAGCMVMEDGEPKMTPHGPEMLHAFLPVSEIEIHDTWFVSGLRGTGSNDFSAEGVHVPAHRVFSLFDPSGHRTEPLYQIPVVALFVSQVAAVALGIARGALDDLAVMAQTKVPSLSQVVLADKPVAQVDLARAEAALGSARAFMHDAIGELYRVAEVGGAPSTRQNALARIAAIHAVETAGRVTATCAALGGGGALYDASPLQRHARDAEAIAHHFTVAPHTWEEAGRVLLGRDPTMPLF